MLWRLSYFQLMKDTSPLDHMIVPILTKPKPKPPVIPTSTPGSGTQTPKSDPPKSETPGSEGY